MVIRVADHPPSRKRTQEAKRRRRKARSRPNSWGQRWGDDCLPAGAPGLRVEPGQLTPSEAIVAVARAPDIQPPAWEIAAQTPVLTMRAEWGDATPTAQPKAVGRRRRQGRSPHR